VAQSVLALAVCGYIVTGSPISLFMSQHRSLKGASTITAKRNVLKRFERVELLKKRGQYKQGDKVVGLRKTAPEA
jgi:small basic protein (TIGR04137 family)